MGLSQDYQKKIKESLDMDENGRLHAIADKAASVNAPVLIVGLGGSGLDTLLATKKMIYDIIQREKLEDGSYSDKPRNIEYLGIDTDTTYETRTCQGMRLNKTAGELQIFTMPQVQPVLKHPDLLPEYISGWLDTSMPAESVINGAGAVRQLGRLLLMQNIGKLLPVLEEKISRVSIGFPATTPLYVFIIAGISGGTGSGTFIDMPYIIRAVAENRGRSIVQTIGLLYLPDVNANRDGMAAVGVSSLYANGFAALKELDYLMNIERTGDSFEQNYGNYQVGRKSDGGALKPYDICLLLSSKDKNGKMAATGNESYELATHVAAETIFNFVLGDTGKTDVADFGIQSWLSNEGKNMETYQTMLGDHRHPISYAYSIAGASSAKLPMDDVMSYLAYRMYKEVEKFWNQNPTEGDIETVENFFKLSRGAINSGARANLPLVPAGQIDARTAINSHQQVIALYEGTLKKQKDKVVMNLQAMQDNLQQMVDDENNIINQYFKDMEKGPVFAQQCLFSLTGRSVITDLRQYRIDFSSKTPTSEIINSYNQQVSVALEDLRSALFKGNKLQIYLDKLNQLYAAKLTVFVNDQLQTFCGNADAILTGKNNEIFDIVSDLLRQMMPIFESYGSIKTSAVTGKIGSTTVLSWSMVDTPTFIKELEKRMENNQQFNVNLQEVVRAFYLYLFENVDKWKDENKDAVEDLNTFIYKQFNTVLNNSMDFFLEIIAESQGKTLTQYCTDIIMELTRKAEVRYPIDSAFASSAVQQPSYSFISIPDNSPVLLKAAKAAAAAATSDGGAPSIVKTSGVRDRIFMMRFMSATPLSLNADIKQFYKVYMQHRDSQKGLQLYVPTKVGKRESDTNWKDLPSPYPESEWVGFSDPKDHEQNEHYRNVLKKAVEYGYVVLNDLEKTMTLYYDGAIDIDEIAAKYSIDLSSDATIKQLAAGKFKKEIEALLAKEGIPTRCTKSIQRSDMVQDVDGKLKESYVDTLFIQMYRPRQEIERMVENHEKALEAVEKVQSRVVDENIVECFVKCRITNKVTRHPKKTGAFIYFDRGGAAQELLTLTSLQSVYQEYYILKSFMALPKQARDISKVAAQAAIDSAEDPELLVKAIQAYRKMILSKIDVLNLDHAEIIDGDKILDSYRNLSRVAFQIEGMLKPAQPDEFNF
ncbi:MAG: tubulin-like doman-containing protein [Lachnospiraceae bacterium]|nr:tubulin-like doman-containing protein [Lachnospiraceae bacterium]